MDFGLIGRGISHSLSAEYFNKKFREEGIDATYHLFDIPEISRLPELFEKYPALSGLNVTSPYKREVIPYLDSLTDAARKAGAVNVVEILREDGKTLLIGHNTDWKGFAMTLEDTVPAGIKALILGTGGAASAVSMAFEQLGIEHLKVSRNPEEGEIDYGAMNNLLAEYHLIVNATPLGMTPRVDECPPVDFAKLTERHICYDLIYSPPESLFLKESKKRGALTINGLDMLFNQAKLSWEIWNKTESPNKAP